VRRIQHGTVIGCHHHQERLLNADVLEGPDKVGRIMHDGDAIEKKRIKFKK
jgi:hypothetical protein